MNSTLELFFSEIIYTKFNIITTEELDCFLSSLEVIVLLFRTIYNFIQIALNSVLLCII